MNNNNKNKLVNPDVKNEFLKNEFAEELYDETAKIGYAPITGGLITRDLVKKGEEMLQNPANRKKSN